MTDVFIGFEGGGTHTSVTLIDRDGNILCEMDDAPCSNIWEIGMDACAQLIVEQVNRAKSLANLSSGTTLRGIGVSLSGLETIRSQQQLVAAVIEKDKSMKETVLVSCNDVQCATQCGIPQGGVLLIAGTGSNCQVSNPSCGSAKFGGWGYMIGDQGSAYYIVHQLIQKTIHLCEGLSDSRFPQHDVDDVKTRLLKYFNITSLDGLLEVYYKDFNRARISGFCVDVANGAESGNTLCKWIFDKAARYLAKHIEAVYPNIQKSLYQTAEGLTILCVGSLWKSYHVFRDAFRSHLSKVFSSDESYRLVWLKSSASVGAALIAANSQSISIPLVMKDRLQVIDTSSSP